MEEVGARPAGGPGLVRVVRLGTVQRVERAAGGDHRVREHQHVHADVERGAPDGALQRRRRAAHRPRRVDRHEPPLLCARVELEHLLRARRTTRHEGSQIRVQIVEGFVCVL